MRIIVTLAALCCGCGFDLRISIGMDYRYGSLQQDGEPIPNVVIEKTFASIDEARMTPIPFEVEDGSGLHSFDLSKYVYCQDDDPPFLDLGLVLTYSTTCLPIPPEDGDTLTICWNGSRCGDVTSIPRESRVDDRDAPTDGN